MVRRILITGANGVGRARFADALAEARPDLTRFHYDAVRRTNGWVQRTPLEIADHIDALVAATGWIFDGGRGLLARAVPHADALVWLDPPFMARAIRLACRPETSVDPDRPNGPLGMPEHLWPLCRLALERRAQVRAFRAVLRDHVDKPGRLRVFHFRTPAQTRDALATCAFMPTG